MPLLSSSAVSISVFVRYSEILESAARNTDFVDVGEEGRMKCVEGGEELGVVGGEEASELEREGGGQLEVEERRRKGKLREGRR